LTESSRSVARDQALTTAGGLVFTGLTDGSVIAYDDMSLEPLWKINVGTGCLARAGSLGGVTLGCPCASNRPVCCERAARLVG